MNAGLDSHRLVLVTSRVGEGYAVATGYLVSERHVLTAAHALGRNVEVRRIHPNEKTAAAAIAWRHPGADLAILNLEESFDLSARAQVRWGRLREGEQSDWEGEGFPAARMEKAPNGRRRRHPVSLMGMVALGRADNLELTVEAGPREIRLWAGISGAPVMVDGALVGVVRSVPRDFDGRRLVATPVSRIVQDGRPRGFIELALPPDDLPVLPRGPLRTGVWALHNTNPAALLLSHHCVVPFDRGLRERELDRLADWLEGEVSQSVALLTGPGGSGKTRLLIELCRERRRDGWRAGFLDARGPFDDGTVHELLTGSDPVLVVLDYATRCESLTRDLHQLLTRHADGGGPHLRVLLADRAESDWWVMLRVDLEREGRHCLPDSVKLGRVAADKALRHTLFADAWRAFGEVLNKPRAEPPGIPFQDPRFERVLFLHAAALTVSLGEEARPQSILDDLLARERLWWRPQRVLSDRNQRLHDRRAARAVAAVGLLGGATTETRAREIVERAVPGAGTGWVQETITTLSDVYPGRGGGTDFIAPLEPDLIGEHLLLRTLTQHSTVPTFLDSILSGASDRELLAAFANLGSVAAAYPGQARKEWIEAALASQFLQRVGPAARAALTLGDKVTAGPLDRAVARTLMTCGDAGVAMMLEEMVPEVTLGLNETAAQALRCLLRDLPETEPVERRARLSNDLGVRLSNLGRYDEALEAAKEATKKYRQLENKENRRYAPKLAGSLSNLAVSFSYQGRWTEAIQAIKEAVRIYRNLAKREPDGCQPKLAIGLSNLSAILYECRRYDEALIAAEEAVSVSQTLARRDQRLNMPELAASLLNLTLSLSELGRAQEALPMIEEAVRIYKALAAGSSGGFLPDVARGLNILASCLSDLGRYEEALSAADDGVTIFRKLAKDRTDPFSADLAAAINTQGSCLLGLGRHDQGLRALEEAVEIYLDLVSQWPETVRPLLEKATHDLEGACRIMGRLPQANSIVVASRALLSGGRHQAGTEGKSSNDPRDQDV